ncbi:MAG TPA: outer membrane protein transport protein, partial [Longimicrobiales bacterium]
MRNWLRILTPAALLLLALVPPAAAQTDGYVMHCFGARTASMGCVTRGQEGIPSTLFKDPAGIIGFKKPALEVNVGALMPRLTFQNQANATPADGALHSYPLGSLAYVGPRFLPTVAWAVGMDPIGGLGADFRLKNAVVGPAQNYESFFAGIKAGPVLAWEMAPGLSFGASASLLYGQIRYFRMPFSMPPQMAKGLAGLAPLDPGLFGSVTEMTAYGDSKNFSGSAVGADLGISWKPSPKLRVSASWSPKSTLKMNGGEVAMDLSAQFGALYQRLVADVGAAAVGQAFSAAHIDMSKGMVGTYEGKTELAIPQTWGVGASYHPADGWTLALEGGWMGWKAAQDTMPFILSGGNNSNLNMLINGNLTANSFSFPLQ